MISTAKRTKGRPTLEGQQEIELAITRATLAVLRGFPAHEATVERIAATAGITKAAIYRRFPDRAALLSGTIAPVLQAWIDRVGAVSHEAPDPLEALRRSFRVMAEEIDLEQRDLWYLVMTRGPHSAPFAAETARWQRSFEQMFDRLVAAAIAAGQIPAADPTLLREMLFFLLVQGPAHKVQTARWSDGQLEDELATSFDERWAFALRGLTGAGAVAPGSVRCVG